MFMICGIECGNLHVGNSVVLIMFTYIIDVYDNAAGDNCL